VDEMGESHLAGAAEAGNDDGTDETAEAQEPKAGKTKRLKGKARKEAKKAGAK
jgi:hypothetical protein